MPFAIAHKNTHFLSALRLENRSGNVPLWLMRQAGRYLPEYRAIRSRHSFMEMVQTPKLACEITTQPIRRFQFDAAIFFSDILVLPDALGLGLTFEDKLGPVFKHPLKTPLDLHRIDIDCLPDSLSYIPETIGMIKNKLDVPLIGFAGAPFTVASYMIEGGTSKNLLKTKKWVVNNPQAFKKLMEILSDLTIQYLEMQVRAGVDAVQLFDTWAGALSSSQMAEFSLPYIKKIIRALEKSVPVILFSKASTAFLPHFLEASPQAISFDINADLKRVRQSMPKMAIQGNFDPDILLGSKESIQMEAKRILESMRGDPGFIFNLGHGIHPETPIAAVQTLIEEIRKFSP